MQPRSLQRPPAGPTPPPSRPRSARGSAPARSGRVRFPAPGERLQKPPALPSVDTGLQEEQRPRLQISGGERRLPASSRICAPCSKSPATYRCFCELDAALERRDTGGGEPERKLHQRSRRVGSAAHPRAPSRELDLLRHLRIGCVAREREVPGPLFQVADDVRQHPMGLAAASRRGRGVDRRGIERVDELDLPVFPDPYEPCLLGRRGAAPPAAGDVGRARAAARSSTSRVSVGSERTRDATSVLRLPGTRKGA